MDTPKNCQPQKRRYIFPDLHYWVSIRQISRGCKRCNCLFLHQFGGFEKRLPGWFYGAWRSLPSTIFPASIFWSQKQQPYNCWDILQGGPLPVIIKVPSYPFTRPFIGFITLFITGRGPLRIIYSSKIPDPQPKNITPHIRQLKKIQQVLSGSWFFPRKKQMFRFILFSQPGKHVVPLVKGPLGKPWQFPNQQLEFTWPRCKWKKVIQTYFPLNGG